MADPADVLARECDAFARYLTGRAASPYVRDGYRRGHRTIPCAAGPPHPLDSALLAAARGGLVGLRSADAYSRFFLPGSALRQKLVLALAVLENSPGEHEPFDSAAVGGVLPSLLAIAGHVALSVGFLALGVARFGPRHLLARLPAPARLRRVEAA